MAAQLDDHGYWSIRPATEIRRITRRYRPETLILETELACSDLICLPIKLAGGDGAPARAFVRPHERETSWTSTS